MPELLFGHNRATAGNNRSDSSQYDSCQRGNGQKCIVTGLGKSVGMGGVVGQRRLVVRNGLLGAVAINIAAACSVAGTVVAAISRAIFGACTIVRIRAASANRAVAGVRTAVAIAFTRNIRSTIGVSAAIALIRIGIFYRHFIG